MMRPDFEALRRWLRDIVEPSRRLAREKAGRDAKIAERFRSDADLIEQARPALAPRVVLWSLLALMGVGLLWAIFGTFDRHVIARGKVVTNVPTVVVQPFQTVRIEKIHVRAGDSVKRGDLLFSFDPAFAAADETSLGSRRQSLVAEAARIEAEVAGRADLGTAWPSDPEHRTEAELFARRTAEYASAIAGHDSRIEELTRERDAQGEIIASLARQKQLAREATAMRRQLYKKEVGSRLQLLAAEREQLDIEQRHQAAMASEAQIAERLRQAEAERQAYVERWNRELNERLIAVRRELNEAQGGFDKATRLAELTAIRAPMDAVVLELAERSVGSVAREAETLATLVPRGATLEVEAEIPTRDRGAVSVGAATRVKLEAYPFQRFGTLEGRVAVIGADAVTIEAGEGKVPVFRARIDLAETADALAKRRIHLGAGLVATAEIRAGRRSIISYLLYPVIRSFDESLREP